MFTNLSLNLSVYCSWWWKLQSWISVGLVSNTSHITQIHYESKMIDYSSYTVLFFNSSYYYKALSGYIWVCILPVCALCSVEILVSLYPVCLNI